MANKFTLTNGAGQGSDRGNKTKPGTGQGFNRVTSTSVRWDKIQTGGKNNIGIGAGQESDMGKRARTTIEADQGLNKGNKNNCIKWSKTRIRLTVKEQVQYH